MCIICRTDNLKLLKNIKILSCFGCPYISEIPSELVNLTTLYCSSTNITYIPKELINITNLNCYGCANLTEIPKELVNLTRIECFNCTNLTSIPKELINLKYIWCRNCPKLLSVPQPAAVPDSLSNVPSKSLILLAHPPS